MVESRSDSSCSMYVPGAPERIAPSDALAMLGLFLAGDIISPSVPSRAPDEYCAQSSIPAAAIVAANTVATRATAVKYLRSGMRTTEGGGEGRRGGTAGDVDHTAGREKRPGVVPARVAKGSDERR